MIKSLINNIEKFESSLCEKRDSLKYLLFSDKYQTYVKNSYITDINTHITVLNMLKEESSDYSYIDENKEDIKSYFKELKLFIKTIPKE